MKELEPMHILAAALDRCMQINLPVLDVMLNHTTDGMERVNCIQAKIPIVKVWDPEYQLAADMNVNNTLALENTRMIKTYVQIDERVRPMAMIIKYWTRQRILNDASKN
jgi:DNA polymerase sigma